MLNQKTLSFCLLFLLLLGCAAGPAQAAKNWQVRVSTTESELFDVSFPDTIHGWAVGEGGVILKSADRGRTWTAEASGTTQNLNSVQMSSVTSGWAVGAARTVANYNGTAWTASQISYPVNLNFSSVRLVGANSIYITAASGFSGGVSDFRNLFYSRDGGVTWSDLNISNTAEASYILNYLYSSFFVDANNGWVVGTNSNLTPAGKVFKTTDGGATWSDVSPVGADDIAFHGVYFADANNGWVVGGVAASSLGNIYHTTDGGVTWTSQYNNTPMFRRVSGTGASDVWVASERASVYHYDGANWSEYTTPLGAGRFDSVNFPDPWNGWAVGGQLTSEGGSQRYIYKYVVDPYDLLFTPIVYVSGATYETSVAISGANIESNAVFTLEAAAGLTVTTSEVKYDPVLRKNRLDLTIRVDPAAVISGTYNFTLANPDEGTAGSGTFVLRESTAPGERPQAVGVAQGRFDPMTQPTFKFQISTAGPVTSSGVHGKAVRSMIASDVQLQLIVLNSIGQSVYRKYFTADPSGYTNVTLQNVNDLGFHPSDGVYRAVVVHPQYGNIGGGVIVVQNSK
jgi:photosystem II stability/assembly factor-like uncharacterized protein